MEVTSEIIHGCLDGCRDPARWVHPLNQAIERYDLGSPFRMSAFLAQTGYESVYFNHLAENLNYNARQLLSLWPELFTPTSALKYEHNPEMIANLIYSNRLGNGSEASGDGWRYRGRGLLQITGKNNYKIIGEALGVDCISDPDLLLSPLVAATSAGQFWKIHALNTFADKQDMITITVRIKGSISSYIARMQLYQKCLRFLQHHYPF